MDKTNQVVKLCRQISDLEAALNDTSKTAIEKLKFSIQIKALKEKLELIQPAT